MEHKVEEIRITVNDYYSKCIGDSVGSFRTPNGPSKKPQNMVQIHSVDSEGNKTLVEQTNNLVVYAGREWVAERIFNINNVDTTSAANEAIYWFGLGQGGCPVDPLTPAPPSNSNTKLADEIPISTDSTSTIYADWHNKGGTDYWFKHAFDSVTYQQDPSNNNRYLIIKVTTTIANDECNFPGNNDVSEAGLFINASSAGGASGIFTLFARVTFSTIEKTSLRSLVFTWYIYV